MEKQGEKMEKFFQSNNNTSLPVLTKQKQGLNAGFVTSTPPLKALYADSFDGDPVSDEDELPLLLLVSVFWNNEILD
jgi:hypothetical protein